MTSSYELGYQTCGPLNNYSRIEMKEEMEAGKKVSNQVSDDPTDYSYMTYRIWRGVSVKFSNLI